MKACLLFFDVLVKYGSVPVGSITLLICTLCRIVGIDSFSMDTWVVVRNILRSHRGHQAMLSLCAVLEDAQSAGDHPNMVAFLRGNIFFISMACWGSERVTSIYYSFAAVLPSFLRVLSLNHPVIAYEVLLSVRRLLRKFADKLRAEWDVIFAILFKCSAYMAKGDQPVEKVLMQTITEVEELAQLESFAGSRYIKFFSYVHAMID